MIAVTDLKKTKSIKQQISYTITKKEPYKVCERMPIIATKNLKDSNIFNTMEFAIDEIKNEIDVTIADIMNVTGKSLKYGGKNNVIDKRKKR